MSQSPLPPSPPARPTVGAARSPWCRWLGLGALTGCWACRFGGHGTTRCRWLWARPSRAATVQAGDRLRVSARGGVLT